MSETCAFIEKMVRWVQGKGLAPVVYAGSGSYGFGNRPSPRIEICYLKEGFFEDLRIGDLRVALPANHVAILSVHHGAISFPQKRIQSWAVFLDVSRSAVFRQLFRMPVFHLVEVHHPAELTHSIANLSLRCRQARWSSPTYPESEEFRKSRKSANIDPVSKAGINSALTELLYTLHREAGRCRTGPGTIPNAVQKALNFVELHYCEPDTTVNRIAEHVHLSGDHFARLFKRYMGESPVGYLRRIRLSRSKVLLTETDMNIQSICWTTGFRDPFHFSRAFKEFAGISPTEYRQTQHITEEPSQAAACTK